MNVRMADTVPAAERAESGGFILVGVVMFMLALTILGLSLFSLSSYEGQFFYSSVSREQSMHNSESGMEVVKALLSARDARLEHAQQAVGQFGITRVLAYQSTGPNPTDTTSRGPINWTRDLVVLVSGRAGSEERTVESRFTPSETKNPYRNLVTCGLGFQYDNSNGGTRTVEMNGKVWQHIQWPSDSAWTNQVNWSTGRPLDVTTAPVPLADAFVDAKLGPATVLPDPALSNSGGGGSYYPMSLDAGSGIRYWALDTPHEIIEHSGDPERNYYGLYFDQRVHIDVRGTNVLVMPAGVCFNREVTLAPIGNSSGTLIIVAKANGRDPGNEGQGIWFKGGIIHSNPNLKVFLVSQSDISVTHDHNSNNLNPAHESRALSVVCGGDFRIMGPTAGSVFRISYGSGQETIADGLLSQGVLPAIVGGSGGGFAYQAASWKETQLP